MFMGFTHICGNLLWRLKTGKMLFSTGNSATLFVSSDTEVLTCQYALAILWWNWVLCPSFCLLLMISVSFQHKPASCEVLAHKGDRVKVHYRVSNFSSLSCDPRTIEFSRTFFEVKSFWKGQCLKSLLKSHVNLKCNNPFENLVFHEIEKTKVIVGIWCIIFTHLNKINPIWINYWTMQSTNYNCYTIVISLCCGYMLNMPVIPYSGFNEMDSFIIWLISYPVLRNLCYFLEITLLSYVFSS